MKLKLLGIFAWIIHFILTIMPKANFNLAFKICSSHSFFSHNKWQIPSSNYLSENNVGCIFNSSFSYPTFNLLEKLIRTTFTIHSNSTTSYHFHHNPSPPTIMSHLKITAASHGAPATSPCHFLHSTLEWTFKSQSDHVTLWPQALLAFLHQSKSQSHLPGFKILHQ